MIKKSNPGQVRIISGQWRGRKISVPAIEGLRPTTEAVRETLFNWLAPIIVGARCLDLFAGSGALGFEALSRGAQHVAFTDTSPVVIKHLQDTAQILQASVDILQVDASKPFSYQGDPFDIVFLDPPFHHDLLEHTCAWLDESPMLASNTYIYIETERALTSLPTPSHWHVVREKNLGQVSYYLLWRE